MKMSGSWVLGLRCLPGLQVAFGREDRVEGHLILSKKEQTKLMILDRVIRDELTLTEAAARLGISFRQASRIRDRYRDAGPAGLVHRSRGVPSKRMTDTALQERIVDLARTEYADIGPTHTSELLALHEGIAIHPETLRLVLIRAGCHTPKPSRRKHRLYRKRKSRFGEMVQLDGSDHEWFEQRGPRCFLMVMVDDATGITHALFSEQETTEAAMQVSAQWIALYGVPGSLYVDRKSVYITDREPTEEEQLAGVEPATQFGRACGKLDIRVIAAHSPQAKGRVEKRNGDLQRRLVVELRLAGISTIEAGNGFLPQFLARFNEKVKKAPISEVDAHRCVPAGMDLRTVFCWEEKRKVAQDWTVQFETRLFQILRKQAVLPGPRAEVTVQRWRDDTVHILYKQKELTVVELDVAQIRRAKEAKKAVEHAVRAERIASARECEGAKRKPADDHPWRGQGAPGGAMAIVDRRPQQQILEEIADRIIGSAIPRGL